MSLSIAVRNFSLTDSRTEIKQRYLSDHGRNEDSFQDADKDDFLDIDLTDRRDLFLRRHFSFTSSDVTDGDGDRSGSDFIYDGFIFRT